jgi:hypothetical protein
MQEFRMIYRDEIPKGTETKFRERIVMDINTMLVKGEDLVRELKREAKRTWKDCLQPTQSA